MRGQRLIGISATHRTAAGIRECDIIEVDVEIDEAPRTIIEPADLAEVLNSCPDARAPFDRLPFGLRQKHVTAIEDARSTAVRERRISKLVTVLKPGGQGVGS
jgi:uncharacterized protein YdeI (YjbR/CyaY-like superfamily)